MQFRLSQAQPALESAQWLEGFLHGSGLLLLHQPALWEILDGWVGEIPEAYFPEILPLLRRTFSRFSGPEREKMLDLARQGKSVAVRTDRTDSEDWVAERVERIQPLLRQIFQK